MEQGEGELERFPHAVVAGQGKIHVAELLAAAQDQVTALQVEVGQGGAGRRGGLPAAEYRGEDEEEEEEG